MLGFPRHALLLGALTLFACTPGRVGTRDGGPVTPPSSDAGTPACTGCTDPITGACLRGTSDTACGPSGGECEVCGDGRTCMDRTCVERAGCAEGDCPGCCDGDVCITSLRADACGAGGAACMACASGEECVDGVCQAPASCGPDGCAGCCDEAGACAAGDTTAACGVGGGLCATCEVGWTCVDGVCTPPCAVSCDGCCDGETCLAGDATSACGARGDACVDCGAGASCSGGVCVDISCSDTCDGCCDGDQCLSGALGGACGASGDACVDCGAGFTCTFGSCQVDPASHWDLYIERASFSVFNPDGALWDPGASGRPDAYATAEAMSASGTVYMGRVSTIDDTTTPVWDELVLTDVPARDLQRGVTIRVRDQDTLNPDDDIGWCYWTVSNNAFNWGRLTLTCPARIAGPETLEIELGVRLVRH